MRRHVLAAILLVSVVAPARGDDPKPGAPAGGAVSFMRDVAPILARHCIACHNPKKPEGKYVMTSFDQLVKGGPRGEGASIVPGKPDESDFIELIRPDGSPRMPYKQEPLSTSNREILERWVNEGAKFDGPSRTEDWNWRLRRSAVVAIPDAYPVPVPVTALAFTPKNGQIAVSGYHEVTTWSLADGKLARRVRPEPERIYDMAYRGDGKFFATAGGDPGQFGSASLWKVEADGSVTRVKELFETTDCVFAVAFSPDGSLLATAGADRAIRIFEVPTCKLVGTIEDHADWIFDVAFSPDGKRLASASRDKTSKVFDVAKREAVATFPGHADAVQTVSFAPDGKLVVTGGGDGQIRVWNPDEDAKMVRNMAGFGGPVFKLVFSPDGKTMAACSSDAKVHIFENYAAKRTLTGHADWIYSVAISPDGKQAASGSWDGEVRIWNLADGSLARVILAAPGVKNATAAK